MQSFKQFFEVPHLDDETAYRRARLLSFLVNLHLTVATIVFILFSTIAFTGITFPIIALSSCIPTLGIHLLIRKGRVQQAAIIFIALVVLLMPLAAVMGKGSVGTVTVTGFQFITIIMAGLLLGEAEVFIVVLITLLINGGLLYAEFHGIYQITAEIRKPFMFWVTQMITYSAGAALVWMANGLIQESLKRANQELTERIHTEEREKSRWKMMEKVINLGKNVTEVTDLHTTAWRIWDSVKNGLDFDRMGMFFYNPIDNTMEGAYGTDRSGNLVDAWQIKFQLDEGSLFYQVLSRPNGWYFTKDFEHERNLPPDHDMIGVKYCAAVAVWAGEKPMAMISVDQLITGRIITDEQAEALRLFAGYAGLAIQNTRLNSELEGRVNERERLIIELENKNAELEHFNYTISHELKAPIVTVKGFLGSIEKDIHDNNLEKAKKDFKRISNATDKMQTTLSDLLELSRVGQIVNSFEEVSLAQLIKEALETLDGRIHKDNVTVQILEGLSTVFADRVRLREVFENLIDNAAKYMGDQQNPLIKIGTRKENEEQIIFIKDNGIGIEAQYQTKIFGLFEKLNPASEGTGIGLALIKRIVEVHGGRIWVESEGVGKGATFCFTLPDDKKRRNIPRLS